MSVKNIIVETDKNKLIEAEAARAVEELQSRTNIITPIMLKGVIEKRLRKFLGPGVVLPKVEIGMRHRHLGGGFDIHITPGDVEGINVKDPK